MSTLFKYIIVGVGTVVLQFALLAFFVDYWMVNPTVSSFMSFAISTYVSYMLFYYWAFQSNGEHHLVATRYLIVTIATLGLNTAIFWAFNELFHVGPYPAQGVASTIVAIINYTVNKHYTFVS